MINKIKKIIPAARSRTATLLRLHSDCDAHFQFKNEHRPYCVKGKPFLNFKRQ